MPRKEKERFEIPPLVLASRAALLDQRKRVDEVLRVLVVLFDPRCDGEDIRVEDDVLGREADLVHEQSVGALADLDLALDRVGLALLVEGHDDDAGAVASDRAGLLEERFLALLEADRVDDSLALDALEARLERAPAGAVDHDRDPGHLGLRRDDVEEGRHRLLGFEEVGVHVHVEEIRAAPHLLEGDVDRALVVVSLDQSPEPGRTGHVRALADHHKARVRPDLERLEAAEARPSLSTGDTSRGQTPSHVRDGHDVVRRRPAATADDVDEPFLRELAQRSAGVPGELVVLPHRIREAGIGVAGDEGRRDPREVLDERPHLGRPQGAVDADDQRIGMLDGRPERLDCLAGQVPAAAVDRGEGDPEREVGRDVLRCDDRGLRVQRVEDRLDHEDVDATLGKRLDLPCIRLVDLVEGGAPERGLVDLRRQ